MTRTLVALNGSPLAGSSVDLLLRALCAGAEEAGGRSEHIRCGDLRVLACQACGPEPTTDYCLFHDDMDRIYTALESAHAIAVGSPVYFDGVSAPLKLVMDRCNCVTPLVRLAGGGYGFRPRWERTRRGVFVTACGTHHTYELAERSVRGFLKWVGARWEETLLWRHDDNDLGSVATRPDLLAHAHALGKRLVTNPSLDPV